MGEEGKVGEWIGSLCGRWVTELEFQKDCRGGCIHLVVTIDGSVGRTIKFWGRKRSVVSAHPDVIGRSKRHNGTFFLHIFPLG